MKLASPGKMSRPAKHAGAHRSSLVSVDRMPARSHRLLWLAFLLGISGLSLALHLFRLKQTYDLFIDEPFYTQVGQSVSAGHMPYATGSLFFLHPPGFFLVEAGWMHLFGTHSSVFAQVYSIRKLVSIFAGLTVLVIALIVDKTAGRLAAIVAATLYMINAFATRDSSFVILEPATVFWALAAYTVLLYATPEPGVKRSVQVVIAGLLFGLSVLSKEFAIFITVVPLVLIYLFRCWISRREAIVAAVLAVGPFSVWTMIVILTGNWSPFYTQLSSGFKRTAGTTQTSGFNRPGAPSFVQAAINDFSFLWTAYAILALGSFAILYLAWKAPAPEQRFIALVGLGAMPLILYCIFIGTNEEQFFNFLLAPALICLVTVIRVSWSRTVRLLRLGVVALALTALASDTITVVIDHIQPDDGTYQIDAWMAEHVPNHTVIAVTNSVQREIFLRYTMIDDEDGQRIEPGVKYLVVFYKQVDENYAFVGRQTVDAQVRQLSPVFRTHDRSNGEMVIYANG